MLGIPILVVAGLTPRRGWRAIIAVALLALVATVIWSFDPAGDVDRRLGAADRGLRGGGGWDQGVGWAIGLGVGRCRAGL